MKRIVFGICILVCSQYHSFGQKDWSSEFNGYIIQKDGRIEKGYLRYKGGTKKNGTKIDLYKSPNSKPITFYSFDLEGYAIEGDTFKILENFKVFEEKDKQFDYLEVKIRARGTLNLYSFQIIKPGAHHGLPAPGPNGLGLPTMSSVSYSENYYIIETKDGIMTGVTKENYKEVLSEFFDNDITLSERLKRNKVKYKDISKIIKEYNAKMGKSPNRQQRL